MSDALPVLVVPDADDTTRRVLSALRAAALAEAPLPAGATLPDLLLRWDRPAALRLGPSATPVRGADGRVLFVEGTLTESAGEDSAAEAEHEGTPKPQPESSDQSLVSALLAYAEAADRAGTPADVCAAAVIAAEQILGAERVAVVRMDESGQLVLGGASRAFEAPLYALLSDAKRWHDYEVPRLASAVPQLGQKSIARLPEMLRPLFTHARHQAALILPIWHRNQPVGAVWAFYETPQSFGLHARQRGGLLAHHMAITLADSVAQRPPLSKAALDSAKMDGARATTPTFDKGPAFDKGLEPSEQVMSEAPLPLKALVGLATVAAYGMECSDEGTWTIAWATKSFRRLLGAASARALSFDDVLAAVHPNDAGGVRAAINELGLGAPTRFDHRLVTPRGEARWVRQAVVRREVDGRAEVLAVLIDIDPDRAALRRAEHALAQARHRASTSVLPALSESLRAPIAAIVDQAQRLSQPGPLRDNDRLQVAQAIAEQGRALSSSLNLMVDLARIEAGEVDLVRADLDFHEAVGRVFDVLSPLAARKGLTIKAQRGTARPIVHQDAHALSRVLHYVVSMAIKEAPAGTLRVRTDERAGMVSLAFRSEAIPQPGAAPMPDHALTSPLNGLVAERLLALMGGRLHREATANASYYLRLDVPLIERTTDAEDGQAAAHTAVPAAPPVSVEEQPVPVEERHGQASQIRKTVGSAPGVTAPEREILQPVVAASATSESDPLEVEKAKDTVLETTPSPLPEEATAASSAMDAEPETSDALRFGAEAPPTEQAGQEEEPLRSMPHRQHASLEAAANALMLFDPFDEEPAGADDEPTYIDMRLGSTDVKPTNTDDRPAVEDEQRVDTKEDFHGPSVAIDSDVEQVATGRPYARTEVTLPVGVKLPYSEHPPRKVATPIARTTDLALDTALDAFAGVEVEPPVAEPPVAEETDTEDATPRPRVLVVEDNPETRLLLERLISREFDVVAVDSPRATLDALTRYPFDALVLDINLGGRETGIDVLRIARSLDGYADAFAMAVTAYGDEVDRDRFLTAGFQAYIQKPFEPHRILEPLRAAIAAKRGAA
ncbi:MAG: response regulator [Bacteroidota bacterium]